MQSADHGPTTVIGPVQLVPLNVRVPEIETPPDHPDPEAEPVTLMTFLVPVDGEQPEHADAFRVVNPRKNPARNAANTLMS